MPQLMGSTLAEKSRSRFTEVTIHASSVGWRTIYIIKKISFIRSLIHAASISHAHLHLHLITVKKGKGRAAGASGTRLAGGRLSVGTWHTPCSGDAGVGGSVGRNPTQARGAASCHITWRPACASGAHAPPSAEPPSQCICGGGDEPREPLAGAEVRGVTVAVEHADVAADPHPLQSAGRSSSDSADDADPRMSAEQPRDAPARDEAADGAPEHEQPGAPAGAPPAQVEQRERIDAPSGRSAAPASAGSDGRTLECPRRNGTRSGAGPAPEDPPPPARGSALTARGALALRAGLGARPCPSGSAGRGGGDAPSAPRSLPPLMRACTSASSAASSAGVENGLLTGESDPPGDARSLEASARPTGESESLRDPAGRSNEGRRWPSAGFSAGENDAAGSSGRGRDDARVGVASGMASAAAPGSPALSTAGAPVARVPHASAAPQAASAAARPPAPAAKKPRASATADVGRDAASGASIWRRSASSSAEPPAPVSRAASAEASGVSTMRASSARGACGGAGVTRRGPGRFPSTRRAGWCPARGVGHEVYE